MRTIKRLYQEMVDRLPPRLRGKLASARRSVRGQRMTVRLAAARARRRIQSDRLFVGWLLSATRDDGPTRMRGLLPHAYLRTRGVHSVVVAQRLRFSELRPIDLARIVRTRFDVVVFETCNGDSAQELAAMLRAAGTRTVYAVGELRRSRMPELVDRVVLASGSLWDLAAGESAKISVIESPIEAPAGACKDYSRIDRPPSIRVVWVGYPENRHLLAPVIQALEDPALEGFELVTISRGPWATLQWDRARVWGQLLQGDIAVLPYDQSEWQRTKPNTRLTMMKALGLPMVASPIPSFTATLTDGRGCYFARDVGDWVRALAALADPERRRDMGLAERDEVLARYGPESIGDRWHELLEDLGRAPAGPVRST